MRLERPPVHECTSSLDEVKHSNEDPVTRDKPATQDAAGDLAWRDKGSPDDRSEESVDYGQEDQWPSKMGLKRSDEVASGHRAEGTGKSASGTRMAGDSSCDAPHDVCGGRALVEKGRHDHDPETQPEQTSPGQRPLQAVCQGSEPVSEAVDVDAHAS